MSQQDEQTMDEAERLRALARVAFDSDLIDHWTECPLPPDAGCDRCLQWFAARAAMTAATGNPAPVTHTVRPWNDHGTVCWKLACLHDPEGWGGTDYDGTPVSDDECWVAGWFSECGPDIFHGSWPRQITFPAPVEARWNGDGCEIHLIPQVAR